MIGKERVKLVMLCTEEASEKFAQMRSLKLVMLCIEEASEEFAQIRKRKNEHVFSYYTANFG